MANYSLLIHLHFLPTAPPEGWPWLSSWTVSITWPRPFRGGPHGDSWPFFPHFFADFWAGKFDCLKYTRKLEVSLYGLFLNKCRYLFFHGMMVVSSKLYVVCFLHFMKNIIFQDPDIRFPLCSSLWLPKLWEATYDTQASDTFYSDRGVTLQSLEITKFVA